MSAIEKLYRVNEIFQSLQGEGFHTGRAAVFLRLSGCNRKCAFCDTNHQPFTLMTAREIAVQAAAFTPRFMVVTGGEPLLQLDDELVKALKEAGFTVAVETNGTLTPPNGVDWVTCSPKERPWGLDCCDELKVVFTSEADVEAARAHFCAARLFLQPLYNSATDSTNVGEVVEYIMRHPEWRLSLQTHRMIGIR